MPKARSAGNGEGLTAARGRSDPAAVLKLELAVAPQAYLRGAAENPELDRDGMVQLLKNHAAPPDLLGRIARERAWTRMYEVTRALARHARTPPPLARELVGRLYWRDLAEVTEDLRIHPTVRRKAEETLQARLSELALGERIALARRASRGVISALVASPEEEVLRALLGNSRLVEADAARIASDERAPRALLGEMAEHPTWSPRRSVALALVRNPRTPVRAALHLLASLGRQDLRALARDPAAPRIVRVGAHRRLETGDDRARPEPRGG